MNSSIRPVFYQENARLGKGNPLQGQVTTMLTNRSPESQLDHPAPVGDNDHMSSETPATDPLPDSEHADTEAVLRHAFERAPLDPEVGRRVDERAARITELVRR